MSVESPENFSSKANFFLKLLKSQESKNFGTYIEMRVILWDFNSLRKKFAFELKFSGLSTDI
jgi:hypothetical protein